uniref:SGNH hydrolase-type esterase domain-containing protein n=1 Tax=Electrophorus electricus TaxID=8005 RepID=A0AAY5EMS9_ELEEL
MSASPCRYPLRILDFQCAVCNMFSYSSSVVSDSFICVKCRLIASLMEKILALAPLESVRPIEELEVQALDALGEVSKPSTPPLQPLQQGECHYTSEIRVSNRFAPLSEAPVEKGFERTLVVGDTIFATPAVVGCIQGTRAPDIVGNLKVLGKHRFSKIVFHVGPNDLHLRHSEITKNNIEEVGQLAKAMSDAVVCAGPIPMRHGDITYSRLSSLNCWMTKWCSQNNVGFIDKWNTVEGKPVLLGQDAIHLTRENAVLLSCNINRSLMTDLVNL